MQRFKLTIEYDGRPFVGWQRQENGPSVQATIEDAITKFAPGEAPRVTGSGRTDAGVHALGQVAHFDLEREMTPDQVQGALNYHMQPRHTVAIVKAEACPELYLGRSYRGLAYAQLRLRQPRGCLENLERSLRELEQIVPALTKIGAEARFFEVRYRAKAAAIAARAHLDLNQLQDAEQVLEPYLNLQAALRNHNLAEIAVHVAIARKDRAAALVRLERFEQLRGEAERYQHLLKVFQRAFGESE